MARSSPMVLFIYNSLFTNSVYLFCPPRKFGHYRHIRVVSLPQINRAAAMFAGACTERPARWTGMTWPFAGRCAKPTDSTCDRRAFASHGDRSCSTFPGLPRSPSSPVRRCCTTDGGTARRCRPRRDSRRSCSKVEWLVSYFFFFLSLVLLFLPSVFYLCVIFIDFIRFPYRSTTRRCTYRACCKNRIYRADPKVRKIKYFFLFCHPSRFRSSTHSLVIEVCDGQKRKKGFYCYVVFTYVVHMSKPTYWPTEIPGVDMGGRRRSHCLPCLL